MCGGGGLAHSFAVGQIRALGV
eukprot:COSAG01_NODE_17145_length_1174_cov_1.400000_1_plen_21_part_01